MAAAKATRKRNLEKRMRIAIVTDCWFPQINGITYTLEAIARELPGLGHEVMLLTPDRFAQITLPYGDPLVLAWYPSLSARLKTFAPDSVHIATQGVLGLMAKLWAHRSGTHYTTAFHTRFPEYARIRFGVSEKLLYSYARMFHGRSAPVLVPSRALASVLRAHGIEQCRLWSRGVDLTRFHPGPRQWTQYERPIQLYVGRVAAEKNIEEFLRQPGCGTKLVVGEGPYLAAAKRTYPDAVFLGPRTGDDLARCYREADVFVMPSTLETFGLVVLEALASGVPVAAIPSEQMVEVFAASGAVAFDNDLAVAIRVARDISPQLCRRVAEQYSWRACSERFAGIIDEDLRHRSIPH